MRLKVWTMRLKVVSMIFVTKFNSNPTVQIVSSVNSFSGGKCSSVFTLLITVNSKVLPVDNVSIGSRCIGCGSSVFSLDLLDGVAWTANLRAGLHSLRFGTCCVISCLICLYHVWNQSTGASCSTSNGKKNERGKRSRRYHSFKNRSLRKNKKK